MDVPSLECGGGPDCDDDCVDKVRTDSSCGLSQYYSRRAAAHSSSPPSASCDPAPP